MQIALIRVSNAIDNTAVSWFLFFTNVHLGPLAGQNSASRIPTQHLWHIYSTHWQWRQFLMEYLYMCLIGLKGIPWITNGNFSMCLFLHCSTKNVHGLFTYLLWIMINTIQNHTKICIKYLSKLRDFRVNNYQHIYLMNYLTHLHKNVPCNKYIPKANTNDWVQVLKYLQTTNLLMPLSKKVKALSCNKANQAKPYFSLKICLKSINNSFKRNSLLLIQPYWEIFANSLFETSKSNYLNWRSRFWHLYYESFTCMFLKSRWASL